MAKIVNATDGGVVVAGGCLDLTSARLIKHHEPTPEGPALVQRWMIEWVLFSSATEAKVARNAGRVLDRDVFFLPYEPGVDPVVAGYALIQAEMEKRWTVTSSVEEAVE